MKFFRELGLLFWICSRRYEQALRRTFTDQAKAELLGAIDYTKRYFPFFNRGYFGGFKQLKADTEQLVGVRVKEVTMPATVLGAYYPETAQSQGMILINNQTHPVFRLSTLAHELCHAVVCRSLKTHHGYEEIRVRNRVTQFKQALNDKEEVLADSLQAIGTYPLPDFLHRFRHKSRNFLSYFNAKTHLKRHYPEVTTGIRYKRGMILNIVFMIHYLRLRMFLYKELDV